MSIPTDKQIKKWRERWDKYPGLADEIAAILKGEEPAQTAEEAARRMWEVNDLVPCEDFEKYTGSGEDFNRVELGQIKVPILDLRGIALNMFDLESIMVPSTRLQGSELTDCIFKNCVFTKSKI